MTARPYWLRPTSLSTDGPCCCRYTVLAPSAATRTTACPVTTGESALDQRTRAVAICAAASSTHPPSATASRPTAQRGRRRALLLDRRACVAHERDDAVRQRRRLERGVAAATHDARASEDAVQLCGRADAPLQRRLPIARKFHHPIFMPNGLHGLRGLQGAFSGGFVRQGKLFCAATGSCRGSC